MMPVNAMTSTTPDGTLLEVKGLSVEFNLRQGRFQAVRDAGFSVRRGETLGLVGESGCGKSMTARAILGIVPTPGRVSGGSMRLASEGGEIIDLATLDPKSRAYRSVRGEQIAMVFQEPMSSFSPVHTIGDQISESVRLHKKVDRRKAREISIETLDLVGIPTPARRYDSYSYQLSGGLRQRAMIAMALVCRPALLLADEPTTALDVTIQAQILDLLRSLQAELGMGMVLVTHDLAVIANTAQQVAVMYLGIVVEIGPVGAIFANPAHPYTDGLIRSVPKMKAGRDEPMFSIPGNVPDPLTQISGCPFRKRCSKAMPGICDTVLPDATDLGGGHMVRCHLYGDGRGMN
jgi:oligopeptide/dipeptide ABC transporter ATP-binding protein